MPCRKIEFRSRQTYHLYNRGVDRQPIFFRPENWKYFIERLRHYFQPELADILAYCLMPTHYHLMVTLKVDDFSTRVMQPFSVSYTKAINRQQERVGPLFQGPFRATWVDKDSYLAHLSRYIHVNPVTAGLATRPEDWAFSSYRDYASLRDGTLPATNVILSQFPSRQAYREFVESYCEQENRIIEHLLLD
jgi:putative transposase